MDPKPDDSGIFTVLLENLSGSTKSSTNLSVIAESQVQDYVVSSKQTTKRTMREMEVTEGDTIRFDIQFTSGDRSQLEFFHEGRRVAEEGESVKISFANDVASLTIEKAQPAHSGTYECVMKTAAGEAKCQIKCKVVPKQQKPAKSEAKEVKSSNKEA